LIKLIENEVAVSKAKLSQDMEKININFSEDPRKKVTLNKDEIESILKSLNKNIIISKENIRESINALNDINIRISTIDDRMNIEISRNYGFKYQQLEKD
jgi:hypothetical protein